LDELPLGKRANGPGTILLIFCKRGVHKIRENGTEEKKERRGRVLYIL